MEKFIHNWEAIRDEGLEQIKSAPIIANVTRPRQCNPNLKAIHEYGWVNGWTNDPGWLNYGLVYASNIMSVNARLCPITTALIKDITTDFNCRVEMAGFSLLKAKCRIPPHRDNPSGSRKTHVYHLGLRVPGISKCYLHVAENLRFHKDGEIIELDDTQMHMAFNPTNEDRLILYVKLSS